MDHNSRKEQSTSKRVTLERTRWSPRLREREEREVNGLMFQVLDNPSLREEILNHVLLGKDKKVDRQIACNLRLVHSSWNESVLRILWKNHQHLFKIPRGKGALEAFLETFAFSSQIYGNNVPSPLKLSSFRFKGSSKIDFPEKLQKFSTTLIQFGTDLVQLGVDITENGITSTDTGALNRWSLPRLSKLKVNLCLDFQRGQNGNDNQPLGGVAGPEDNLKLSSSLIQSLFDRASVLNELDLWIYFPIGYRQTPPPGFSIFESVTLPPTLTKINMTGELMHQDFLEMLARNPLPNLTWLTFTVGIAPVADDLLFRVLDKCQSLLKSLVIESFRHRPPRKVLHIRFPVMDNLEQVSINSINVELEAGLHSLERCLPKLRSLRLQDHTNDMFRKWTGCSSGVDDLQLSLADENFADDERTGPNFKVSLNTEMAQRINFAFPNLRKLEVAISPQDTSGLQELFMTMDQLTELKIRVIGRWTGMSPDVWDSILTGVPEQMIAGSREELDVWEETELEGEHLASIRNLRELRSFSIRGYLFRFHIGLRTHTAPPQISDFTFNHALLKMPKLKHLSFQTQSQVSDEMTEYWMSSVKGRTLTYHR